MMERTAAMLVYPLLPEGKATVGFEVCVRHVGAAPLGSRCVARARLRDVRDDRKLLFDVEVVDQDQRTIGIGTHQRRMVDAKALPQNTDQPTGFSRFAVARQEMSERCVPVTVISSRRSGHVIAALRCHRPEIQ
jgi:predicted thioesterase